MGGVFISYRRKDSEGQARALFKDLSEMLGKGAVFMDVDSIALGRDFRESLQEHLASCDSMLVLIGPRWLTAEDSSGRRLDHPDDFVRQEIAGALTRKIPVTPVLVQGARIPDQSELPEGLKDLAYRNGFELSHTRWDSDVRELFQRLGLPSNADKAPTPTRPSRRRTWIVVAALPAIAVLLWVAKTQWFDGLSTSARGDSPTSSPSSTPNTPQVDRPRDRPSPDPSLELEYAVGAGEVLLEVNVGFAQIGTSRVTVDGQELSSSSSPIFKLGRGDTLVGKTLAVATIVTDVNVGTNKIGVGYRLSGGLVPFPWTVSNPSTSEGGSRTFRTSVRLIGDTASGAAQVRPPAACTAFYGTYEVALTLSSGAASCGTTFGSRWTLSGKADCSNFEVFEVGSNIRFRGTIRSDGTFKATGSGATIDGRVAGNQIAGSDTNPACTFKVSGHR